MRLLHLGVKEEVTDKCDMVKDSFAGTPVLVRLIKESPMRNMGMGLWPYAAGD